MAHGTHPSPQFVNALPALLEERMTARGSLKFSYWEYCTFHNYISVCSSGCVFGVAPPDTLTADWPTDWLSKKYLTNYLTDYIKGMVKCTPVQTLRLCTGRTAHRESRGIALLFLGHGTRRGEGSASRPGRSLPRERPIIHFIGGWVGPRAGLQRCGKSRPHRDSIPYRPARSESLYCLRYPAHNWLHGVQ